MVQVIPSLSLRRLPADRVVHFLPGSLLLSQDSPLVWKNMINGHQEKPRKHSVETNIQIRLSCGDVILHLAWRPTNTSQFAKRFRLRDFILFSQAGKRGRYRSFVRSRRNSRSEREQDCYRGPPNSHRLIPLGSLMPHSRICPPYLRDPSSIILF